MTAESKRNEAMIPDIPDEKFRVIGIDENAGETRARKRIGYWQDAWRRFKENKIALVAAIILIVLIFFILFGPAISGYEFEEIDSNAINQGPSAAHWFGTDNLG